MNRKLHTVYFSATNTTRQVVQAIAGGIGSYTEHDLTMPPGRSQTLNFGENDLVIFGVPVYAGRVPAFLMDCFAGITGRRTPAVFVVVYGNRAYEDALLELKDTFEQKGFIGVAGGAFIGEHSYTDKVATGRPDEADLAMAKRLGADIKALLSTASDMSSLSPLTVHGNAPYKAMVTRPPMKPDTDSNCTDCGLCARSCPTGAIDSHNFRDIDAAKCIKCCCCVKRCPVGAKSLNHRIINTIRQALIDNFSQVRHEPELFVVSHK